MVEGLSTEEHTISTKEAHLQSRGGSAIWISYIISTD